MIIDYIILTAAIIFSGAVLLYLIGWTAYSGVASTIRFLNQRTLSEIAMTFEELRQQREHDSHVEELCQRIHKMLEVEHRNTTTAVLAGVLALHLSRAYDSYAVEALDSEYVPSIKALINYHQHGKLGNH